MFMANTYSQIYVHFVFAVQNRMSLISPVWKTELYKYIIGIISKNESETIAVRINARC